MSENWFIVANQSRTNVYKSKPGPLGLAIVKRFSNPLGRERNRTLIRKRHLNLTLIAEPRFLGKLRNAMDSDLERCVVSTIRKDLLFLSASELAARIYPTTKKTKTSAAT